MLETSPPGWTENWDRSRRFPWRHMYKSRQGLTKMSRNFKIHVTKFGTWVFLRTKEPIRSRIKNSRSIPAMKPGNKAPGFHTSCFWVENCKLDAKVWDRSRGFSWRVILVWRKVSRVTQNSFKKQRIYFQKIQVCYILGRVNSKWLAPLHYLQTRCVNY